MFVHRSGAALLVLALTAGGGAACAIDLGAENYVNQEKKSFSVSGNVELVVKTHDGAIEVTSWDQPTVALIIERRASSQPEAERLKVATQQTGNRLVIEAVQPDLTGIPFRWHQGGSVRFILQVPRQSSLNASSGDGAISVAGIAGRVDLHSGDGAVAAADLGGDASITSGDGAVAAENIAGALTITTGDGAVQVAGAPRTLRAHTGDGAVNVDVTANPVGAGTWELTTGDGAVHVALPAGFNARLDVHTGDGGINAQDWGLRAEGENGRDLRATLGAGGPLLSIHTGDGGISLTKR